MEPTLDKPDTGIAAELPAQRGTRPPGPGPLIIVTALLPFGLGYFLSYLYRAANAVVAPDLVRDAGLTAAELGLMTAAYLFAFAAFQLPLGILLDRYGPRRVQAALVAIGGIGALLFGLGQSVTTLLIARAVIGLGFAGGLMSAFKAVVIWVPEARRPLANSIVMSAGALGLIVSTTPLELAVQAVGWRHVFFGLATFTFLVAALILFLVPERSGGPRVAASLAYEFRHIGCVARSRVFLALAPLIAIVTGVHISIQTLWAGPWLRDVAGLDRQGVANRLFLMAVAFFAGILISGAIADWLTRRGASLLHIMLGFLMIFLTAQLGLILELAHLDIWLWTAFSMTGQVGVLIFPWLGSYFGANLSGRANSAMNLPMFMMAFVFQYAIGAMIDLVPPVASAVVSGGYPPAAYRLAFGVLLGAEILALGWYLINWRAIAEADKIVLENYRARNAKV